MVRVATVQVAMVVLRTPTAATVAGGRFWGDDGGGVESGVQGGGGRGG